MSNKLQVTTYFADGRVEVRDMTDEEIELLPNFSTIPEDDE